MVTYCLKALAALPPELQNDKSNGLQRWCEMRWRQPLSRKMQTVPSNQMDRSVQHHRTQIHDKRPLFVGDLRVLAAAVVDPTSPLDRSRLRHTFGTAGTSTVLRRSK